MQSVMSVCPLVALRPYGSTAVLSVIKWFPVSPISGKPVKLALYKPFKLNQRIHQLSPLNKKSLSLGKAAVTGKGTSQDRVMQNIPADYIGGLVMKQWKRND
ncbi:hypothetical protein P5673_002697 [Acropora cervicornis]|uniref:Uncharacterized protein n=1 Tax=Acropora cervicornis TaxID=6130 RepID=A0AAD9R423_ACRCE|nr:hypothetical protein P5673_002697 [Acropora cervicornis]